MEWVLTVSGNGLEPTEYQLDEPWVHVGRHPQCGVALDSPAVSRLHADLRLERDAWLLRDLGSFNGCVVGGRRVNTARLVHGSTFRIGPLLLRLEQRAQHGRRPSGWGDGAVAPDAPIDPTRRLPTVE